MKALPHISFLQVFWSTLRWLISLRFRHRTPKCCTQLRRKTNASAESLNSKIKCFRSQVKGVKDIPFFMYRLATVLG